MSCLDFQLRKMQFRFSLVLKIERNVTETEHSIPIEIFFLKGYFQVMFVKQANSISSIDSANKTKPSHGTEQTREKKTESKKSIQMRQTLTNSNRSSSSTIEFSACVCALPQETWAAWCWLESFSLKCEFENCVLLFKCTACWCVIQLCHFWVACSFIWAHTTAANTTINVEERKNSDSSWKFRYHLAVQNVYCVCAGVWVRCLQLVSTHQSPFTHPCSARFAVNFGEDRG